MLLVLSKVLALLLYPIGITVGLLAAAAALLFFDKQKIARLLVLVALGVAYLFSSGPLSYLLVRSLERQYAPCTTFPPVAAVVLLSGGEVAMAPPRLFDEVNGAGDRIIYSARLMKAHTAPLLVVTGGNIGFLRSIHGSQAEASFRLLAGPLGVDSSVIVLEKMALTTYENGLYTGRLLDSLKLARSVILVTSAMHMPRSVAIFTKLGFTVYPAPTDYLVDTPYRWKPIALLPSAEALNNSTDALHEVYGIAAYKLLGRL